MHTTGETELLARYDAELSSGETARSVGGLVVVGAVAPGVLRPGDVPPEELELYADLFTHVPDGVDTAKICGDDRPLTAASARQVNAYFANSNPARPTLDVNRGYGRIYGGLAGLSKNILIAGCVQYGPDFIDRMGGLDGMMKQVDEVTEGHALVHSDEKHEGDDATFSEEGSEAVGCLYCNALGATCDLHSDTNEVAIDTNYVISSTAYDDQVRLFGPVTTDVMITELFNAQGHLGGRLAAQTPDRNPMSYSFGRSRILGAIVRQGRPAAVLAGRHASVGDTLLIKSYHRDRVGNPAEAVKRGMPFYGEDLAHAVHGVGPLLQDHDILPSLVLQATEMDSVPVRAALGAHDEDKHYKGRYDPASLRAGTIGDPVAAATELNDLFGN